jgi:hypothetical protein
MFTDSYYDHAFCDGSTFHYTMSGMEMVPPDLAASFTSVNMGTATFDSTHGPGVIVNPTDAVFSVKARSTAKPGTGTWHVILALRSNGPRSDGNASAGIFVRDSVSGKMIIAGIFQALGGITVFDMTNPTTFSGIAFNGNNTAFQGLLANYVYWIRVGNNGVNRTWDYSLNQGVSWINFYSEGTTNFLTEDTVGYYCQGAASGIIALHWAITI